MKIFKKQFLGTIVLFLLTLIMSFSTISGAFAEEKYEEYINEQENTLFISGVSGTSTNEDYIIDVRWDGHAPLSSYQFNMTLPCFIDVQRVQRPALVAPNSVFESGTKGDMLTVTYSSAEAITSNSVLFQIVFRFNDDTPQSFLPHIEDAVFTDINFNNINVYCRAVPIEFIGKENPQRLMGDVDYNGVVELNDVMLIQQSIVLANGNGSTLVGEEFIRADINCDGIVNIVDCQYIQMYLVGRIDSLENVGGGSGEQYEYYELFLDAAVEGEENKSFIIENVQRNDIGIVTKNYVSEVFTGYELLNIRYSYEGNRCHAYIYLKRITETNRVMLYGYTCLGNNSKAQLFKTNETYVENETVENVVSRVLENGSNGLYEIGTVYSDPEMTNIVSVNDSINFDTLYVMAYAKDFEGTYSLMGTNENINIEDTYYDMDGIIKLNLCTETGKYIVDGVEKEFELQYLDGMFIANFLNSEEQMLFGMRQPASENEDGVIIVASHIAVEYDDGVDYSQYAGLTGEYPAYIDGEQATFKFDGKGYARICMMGVEVICFYTVDETNTQLTLSIFAGEPMYFELTNGTFYELSYKCEDYFYRCASMELHVQNRFYEFSDGIKFDKSTGIWLDIYKYSEFFADDYTMTEIENGYRFEFTSNEYEFVVDVDYDNKIIRCTRNGEEMALELSPEDQTITITLNIVEKGLDTATQFSIHKVRQGIEIQQLVHAFIMKDFSGYAVDSIVSDYDYAEVDCTVTVYVSKNGGEIQPPEKERVYVSAFVEMYGEMTQVGRMDVIDYSNKTVGQLANEVIDSKYYVVAGAYSDFEFTQPLDLDAPVQVNNIYVKVVNRDFSGSYDVYELGNTFDGRAIYLENTTRLDGVITLNCQDQMTGNFNGKTFELYNVGQGMLVANYGENEQDIFVLHTIVSATEYGKLVRVSHEEVRVLDEEGQSKYQDIAGTYRIQQGKDFEGSLVLDVNGYAHMEYMGIVVLCPYTFTIETTKKVTLVLMDDPLYLELVDGVFVSINRDYQNNYFAADMVRINANRVCYVYSDGSILEDHISVDINWIDNNGNSYSAYCDRAVVEMQGENVLYRFSANGDSFTVLVDGKNIISWTMNGDQMPLTRKPSEVDHVIEITDPECFTGNVDKNEVSLMLVHNGTFYMDSTLTYDNPINESGSYYRIPNSQEVILYVSEDLVYHVLVNGDTFEILDTVTNEGEAITELAELFGEYGLLYNGNTGKIKFRENGTCVIRVADSNIQFTDVRHYYYNDKGQIVCEPYGILQFREDNDFVVVDKNWTQYY